MAIIPTHDALVTNIISWYVRADAGQREAGRCWYPEAERTALALAAGTDLSVDQTAGVLAVLSPRITWDENVRGAARLVDSWSQGFAQRPQVPGFGANADKAWRILASRALVRSIVKGPKVERFFANILGDRQSVTVDTWAQRIACDWFTETPSNRGGRKLATTPGITPTQYAQIERAYQDAARRLGLDPRDLQAITWITVRAIYEPTAQEN